MYYYLLFERKYGPYCMGDVKARTWLCESKTIVGAFSRANVLSRTSSGTLDTDSSSEHITVIPHERMAAVRRGFNQCVIRLGEHPCLVLLFDDDFFWE